MDLHEIDLTKAFERGMEKFYAKYPKANNIMKYVVGFLFDDAGEKVALILKKRPVWQEGKLNGIGGKIEKHRPECISNTDYPASDQMNFQPCNCSGETPLEAMEREFEEETGVKVTTWKHYATLSGKTNADLWYDTWMVDFFVAFSTVAIQLVHTQTDEEIRVINVKTLFADYATIPNLQWLIPMAITNYDVDITCRIQEVNNV